MNTSCNGINDQMNGGEDLFQTKFPIHHACRVGNGSFLTEVVQSGQASLQHFTQEDTLYYRSPIHWAALNAQGEIIKGLVKLGVDINTQTSISKLSALHFAVKTGNEILVKMMIFDLKANPNLQDKNNETVLHKSAQLGDFQMINIFLNHGADVFIKNNLGLTAFKVAEQLGHRKCANLLSQKQISCQLGHRGESLLNGTSGAMNCIENGLNHGKNGFAMIMHQSNGKKRACQPNCVQDENGFVAKRMRQSEAEAPLCAINHVTHHHQSRDKLIEDEFQRPESPGMDMNLDEYLHRNGWGDTAEDPNDQDGYPDNHKVTQGNYNGFHNMGWTP